MLMVLEVIAFEVLAGFYVNYDWNTCDQPSTCSKAILRFKIRLTDTIHNSNCLILIEH